MEKYKRGDIVEFADNYGKWTKWEVSDITYTLNKLLKVEFIEIDDNDNFIRRRCTRYFKIK